MTIITMMEMAVQYPELLKTNGNEETMIVTI